MPLDLETARIPSHHHAEADGRRLWLENHDLRQKSRPRPFWATQWRWPPASLQTGDKNRLTGLGILQVQNRPAFFEWVGNPGIPGETIRDQDQ